MNEEIANAITHGLGALLSVIGLVFLVVFSGLYGTVWHTVSCVIFGGSMTLLYTSSTIYHSVRNRRAKVIFKLLDHASIYLLIAGTYTPFTLVNLRGGWGWALFGLIWGLAVLGLIFKLFFINRFETLSTVLYILMGWVVVVAVKPIMDNTPLIGLLWLVGGGLAYTSGVIFYVLDKKMPYSHTIWHLFVLVGSFCHFMAIILYVLPASDF